MCLLERLRNDQVVAGPIVDLDDHPAGGCGDNVSGRRRTTTTGHWAFKASVAAVDPNSRLATHPMPTDPTQTIAAVRDSAINALSGESQTMSVSTLTVLPVADDGRRCGAQCGLAVLDFGTVDVERDRWISYDAGGVHEAKWYVAVDGLIDGP